MLKHSCIVVVVVVVVVMFWMRAKNGSSALVIQLAGDFHHGGDTYIHTMAALGSDGGKCCGDHDGTFLMFGVAAIHSNTR